MIISRKEAMRMAKDQLEACRKARDAESAYGKRLAEDTIRYIQSKSREIFRLSEIEDRLEW